MLELAFKRIKDFYGWSEREFRFNYLILKTKTDVKSLLIKLAFSDDEIDKLEALMSGKVDVKSSKISSKSKSKIKKS